MNNLLNLAQGFVGIPFKSGSFDPKDGLCCITYISHFFSQLDGKPVNINLTEEEISDGFRKYRETRINTMLDEYVNKYMNVKKYPCLLSPSDIIILNLNIGTGIVSHLGIYLGNNYFTHCYKPNGVKIHRLGGFIPLIEKIGTLKDGVRNA